MYVAVTPPLTPVLREAARTQRITCGVMDCARLLRSNHDNMMLCVLPEVSGHHDVTVDIQHTLIEAFCWENHITVIKIGDVDKLCSMLCQQDNIPDITSLDDITCILIEYPSSSSPGSTSTSATSECRGRRPSLFSTHREVPP